MAPRRDLTPADACWLYSEWENNHQTVSAFMWTDARIEPDDLREVVQTRLVDKYPVFAQRAVMSRNPLMMPHWEDDPDFDLDRHIEVVQCPAPGDKAALEALVSTQRTPLLDRDRPLWKVYLIQDCEGGTSAVHTRIQHAIADGWSLVRLFLSLSDEADDAEGDEDGEAVVDAEGADTVDGATNAEDGTSADDGGGDRRGRESPLRLRRRGRRAVSKVRRGLHPSRLAAGRDALDETLSLVVDPSRFVEFGSDVTETLANQVQEAGARLRESAGDRLDEASQARSRIVEGARLARSGVRDGVDFTFPPRPGKTILHGEVGGQKLVAWMDPVPLPPVKAAGKVYGATINDVLLAAQTNALRQYLVDRDALTVDELFTAVPVSLRNPDEELPPTLGNKFGLVPVLLPVGLEDPIEQIHAIKAQMDEIKASTMPIMSFGLMSLGAMATAEVERQIHKLNQAHSIGVTTNVPGPRHELWLCGARVLGAWGMGGVSGDMNLSFGIFTLNGELNYAVHSDAALTSDPEEIARLFSVSVGLIERTAGVSSA